MEWGIVVPTVSYTPNPLWPSRYVTLMKWYKSVHAYFNDQDLFQKYRLRQFIIPWHLHHATSFEEAFGSSLNFYLSYCFIEELVKIVSECMWVCTNTHPCTFESVLTPGDTWKSSCSSSWQYFQKWFATTSFLRLRESWRAPESPSWLCVQGGIRTHGLLVDLCHFPLWVDLYWQMFHLLDPHIHPSFLK